jgi:hypothetical protein
VVGCLAELCNDMKARGYILDELNKTGKKLRGCNTLQVDLRWRRRLINDLDQMDPQISMVKKGTVELDLYSINTKFVQVVVQIQRSHSTKYIN